MAKSSHRRKLMKLTQRFKLILFLTCGGLYFAGAVIWIFSRWVRIPSSFGETHHPIEAWATRLHSFFGFLILVLFGYLIRVHIEPGLKGNRRKSTGVTLSGVFLILSLTAFPILYSADGWLRESSQAIHLYLGLSSALLFWLHKKT